MRIIMRLLPILLFTLPLSAMRAEEVCKVTDPTGTPLNVRATPKGKIVGTVKNGTKVDIEQEAEDNTGTPWVKVSTSGKGKKKVLGWVVREFISCYTR